MNEIGPSFILLENEKETELPSCFTGDDVRFPKSLPQYFINRLSQPKDIIFDPFAGFGTTLIVAEDLDRTPCGVEFDRQRYEHVISKISNRNLVIHGDSLKLPQYNLPSFDFSFTSPPYMAAEDTENPFTNYTEKGDGYEGYLRDIKQIYSHIQAKMKPNTYAVIEISNVKTHRVTTLAWDVASVVSRVLTFKGEIVVGWNGGYGQGYDHSYCLVFKNEL